MKSSTKLVSDIPLWQGILSLGVNSLLVVFFYKYAFINPDEGECWVDSTHVDRLAWFEETEIYDYNVSQTFNKWFIVGFSISVLCVMWSACVFAYHFLSNK